MLDHVLADPMAVGRVLAREWHSKGKLEVVFAFSCSKVILLEGHGILKLGLVGLEGLNDLILIIRLGDFLLESGKFLHDLFLVLLELLHSSHVKHVPALEVGGIKVRIAVPHEVAAGLLVHDELPSLVVSDEEPVVVGVTGHTHHTNGKLEESLEALLLGLDELNSVELSSSLGKLLLHFSLLLLSLLALFHLLLKFLLGNLLLGLPFLRLFFAHLLFPFLQLVLALFLSLLPLVSFLLGFLFQPLVLFFTLFFTFFFEIFFTLSALFFFLFFALFII